MYAPMVLGVIYTKNLFCNSGCSVLMIQNFLHKMFHGLCFNESSSTIAGKNSFPIKNFIMRCSY